MKKHNHIVVLDYQHFYESGLNIHNNEYEEIANKLYSPIYGAGLSGLEFAIEEEIYDETKTSN